MFDIYTVDKAKNIYTNQQFLELSSWFYCCHIFTMSVLQKYFGSHFLPKRPETFHVFAEKKAFATNTLLFVRLCKLKIKYILYLSNKACFLQKVRCGITQNLKMICCSFAHQLLCFTSSCRCIKSVHLARYSKVDGLSTA